MGNNINITDKDIDILEEELANEYSFDKTRRNIIKGSENVQACPGSGKTILVGTKLLLLAKKWDTPFSGICAITHTNVAKNEILKIVIKHPSGYKLLSYPHFIGTIQEFVDKYLGIPYLRSIYGFKLLSENNEIEHEIQEIEKDGFNLDPICKKVYIKCDKANFNQIKKWLGSLYYLNSNFDLAFFGQNGIKNKYLAKNNSDTYQLLSKLKEEINKKGFFHFRDIYAFAGRIINLYPETKVSIQNRFKYIFIDEMQDTQKFQDELITEIFGGSSTYIQKFGDPDQAIFNGMSEEQPNESFNKQKNLESIDSSYRFGNDIAEKIKGLSYNRLLSLNSIRKEPSINAPHTIFLYDAQSINKVLPAFSDLVIENLKPEERLTIKAVGGIGIDKQDSLTIKNYWEDFDKNHAINTFKPTKLIDIIGQCSLHKCGNIANNYNLIIKGILDLLRRSKKLINGEYYNKTSLFAELKTKQNYYKLRSLITEWILNEYPDKETWDIQIKKLIEIIEIPGQLSQEALNFVSHEKRKKDYSDDAKSINNIFQGKDGLEIELGTIHSIKGETHDATLILETKFYEYDLHEILDYLINFNLEAPEEAKRKTGFLRRIYVAASRPRHLLCFAINKDHISSSKRDALTEIGWKIEEIN